MEIETIEEFIRAMIALNDEPAKLSAAILNLSRAYQGEAELQLILAAASKLVSSIAAQLARIEAEKNTVTRG